MAKTIGQLTAESSPAGANEMPISVSNVTKKVTVTNLLNTAVTFSGTKTLADATDIAVGTTTGTKIGTVGGASGQKLGFFGATPVVQQPIATDLLDSLQNLGLIVSGAGNTPLNLTSGALTCGTLTAGAATATSLASTGAVTSSGTAGIGYATGAGGTITQATSRTTSVQIDDVCGSITMFSAAGSTTAATFTVNNSTVGINDVIILNQRSGTNLYDLIVTAVAAGSFNITFRTTGGTATDAPVINFAVIKAVTS